MKNKNDPYTVEKITRINCTFFVLNVHYARRWPSISYAFGLFLKHALIGVVTYGTPPSSPLRKGIAGERYKYDILELNRLCLLHNKKK